MNIKETKAMWIGANKGSSTKPLYLDWFTGAKNLGIHFSCHKGEAAVQNLKEIEPGTKKTIYLSSMRGLSLFGKVAIVKTFLIPKMLYVSCVI